MFTYKTRFFLTHQVPQDEMEKIQNFFSDRNENRELPVGYDGIIESINWHIKGKDWGFIEVSAFKKLNMKERELVKQWIKHYTEYDLAPDFVEQEFSLKQLNLHPLVWTNITLSHKNRTFELMEYAM